MPVWRYGTGCKVNAWGRAAVSKLVNFMLTITTILAIIAG